MNAQADLIQQSFAAISDRGEELTEAFYRNLFTDYPQTSQLFANVDLIHQRRKLWAMVTLIATGMKRIHLLAPVLKELGQRHVRYGVEGSFYKSFLDTFMKSLKEIAGDALTHEAADAWERGLGLVCQHMIEGANLTDSARPVSSSQSDDLAMLMEISGQARMSSANTRLYSSFLEKKKHDYEMEVARSVQRALLPETLPKTGEYEFFASYVSALEVGGDYYDYIVLDDEKICLSFGDVSGKGVPGALVMSRLASAVQCTVPLADDAVKAVAAINRHMCQRADPGRFVTFILLILDPKEHSVSMVNAGHRPPMMVSCDGSIEDCGSDEIGLPLGIVSDYEHSVHQRSFNPGDTMVLFTDGIDEAMNASGQRYGITRLVELLSKAPKGAAELGPAILSDVSDHAHGHPPSDDMTVVALTRGSCDCD